MATQTYQGTTALTRQQETGTTDTPRQAQYSQQAAGPSSSTPHPQFPGVSTEDIQLQRLTELEIQYGISPPRSPNEMPIEARLERIDGLKRDRKAEDRLRRDRRRSIRQLEHSVRIGSAARREDTGSGGSAGTTTTTHDRVERLETDLSRLDARLEEDFSKIDSRITDVFGKLVEEFKGTRQESTIVPPVVTRPEAPWPQTAPARPSVGFADATTPHPERTIQTIPAHGPIEALSMFTDTRPQVQTRTYGGEPTGPERPTSFFRPGPGGIRDGIQQGGFNSGGTGWNGFGNGPGAGGPGGNGHGGGGPGGGLGPGGGGGSGPGGGPGPGGGSGPGGGGPSDFRNGRDSQQRSRPNVPKQAEVGDFNPADRRPLAYWIHLEHFRSQGLYEDAAILGIVGSCMKGAAKDWWDTIWPRPTTWDEWRTYFFRRWTKDPTAATLQMLQRRFKPRSEALSSYLYDKYWLVGMEGVSRLVYNQPENIRIVFPDEISRVLNQRSSIELIGMVHNGLPSNWQLQLLDVMERATTWEDYVQRMIKRETYLRDHFGVYAGEGDDDIRTIEPRRDWTKKNVRHASKRSSAIATGQPRSDEEKEQRKKDRETGGCFLCHEVGHAARDCPKGKGKGKYVRRVESRVPNIAKVVAEALRSGSDSDGTTSTVEEEDDFFTDDTGHDSENNVRKCSAVRTVRRGTSDARDAWRPGTLHQKAASFKLPVKVEGEDQYELLLDSGSEISLISSRALTSLAPDIEKFPAQDIELQGFDSGKSQRTLSVVVLPVSFVCDHGEERVEWCEFHEVERCSDGWLLGVDNILEKGIACDPVSWTVTFGRTPIMRASMIPPKKPRGASKNSKKTTVKDEETFSSNQTSTQAPIDLSGLALQDETIFRELDIEYPTGSEKVSVAVSASLSKDQQDQLLQVLSRQKVWPTKERPLGLYEKESFDIELKEGQETWTHSEPPRRTSPAQREAIETTLKEHDELGLSEPGISPHSSGIVLVPQRDKIRFCVDYRPLNEVTKDVSYYTPRTDEVYDLIQKAIFLTTVDCNKGYHQFACTNRARVLLAFITVFGIRLWNRMPFGPKTAPAFFQRIMDTILSIYRFVCAIAYLDDVLIFSATYEDHLRDVDNVLSALGNAGLTVAPKKCAFGFTSLKLLGYRAHALGIMVDEERTRAVRDFPVPQTAKQTLRFYAMASWYRKFIQDFAKRARPLHEAIHEEPFRWGTDQQRAFNDIKVALSSTPILRRPNFDKPFILDVDASSIGFGAALIQTDDNNHEHPVIYISRQTKDTETRYSATDLELQAIVWAISKLSHFIDGSVLTIRSDHQALTWLWNLKTTAPSQRLQRLALSLAPLRDKIRIEYRKGSHNNVADALSRAPVPEPDDTSQVIHLTIHNTNSDNITDTTTSSSSIAFTDDEIKSWDDAYNNDKTYKRIWRRLKLSTTPTSRNDNGNQEEGTGPVSEIPGNKGGHMEENADQKEETGEEREQAAPERGKRDKKKEKEAQGRGKEKGKKEQVAPARGKRDKAKTKIDETRERDQLAEGNGARDDKTRIEEERGQEEGLKGRRRSPRLAKAVKSNVKEDEAAHPRFFKDRGLLFERSGPRLERVRICVPEDKIGQLLIEFHSSARAGHPSARRTAEKVKKMFTFPDLHSRIDEMVRACFECQTNKGKHHLPYGQLLPIYSPAKIFTDMGIDFVTGLTPSEPDHFDAITVMADKFSKYAIFWPSKTTDTAKDTARRFIHHAYPWTGLPTKLISDRDVRFTSEFWRTLVEELGIQHSMSTAYHPQTDGQVERLNQQLAVLLRNTVALDQHDWPDQLPIAMTAYNNTVHESSGIASQEVVFGRPSRLFPLEEAHREAQGQVGRDLSQLIALHQDVQERLLRAQTQQKVEYDRRHQPWDPKKGDWVLVRSDHYKARLDPTQRSKVKLEAKQMGPFEIAEVIEQGAFKLKTPAWFKAHNTLPIQALEPFHGDPAKVTPRPIVGVTEEGARPERRVLGFLGRRPTQFNDGRRFDYLVKWAGTIEPTWQSDTRLSGLRWAIQDFVAKVKEERNKTRLGAKEELVLKEGELRARVLRKLEQGSGEG
ncbi:hypothetical protein CF336_g2219 [Tilletia laevis]|nr:hypothetical protein CF335_g6586 [Tilletia laevis]KAE8197294.1 hypothetical protein CF336_g2219 [Tilletia laevis]